ncbi:metalloprotease TldD [thiotrophic endosymbiont of Bathymodiolus puteoserpentis (Logatchev)]|jgi:TldD protein|uniref:metalloprotease TldD n=1 Tax=thiotrophic endosymbiont of Bathymodiolus puteoserpentis (Logatchev) TaxID=343240 RepID=UPI0010B1D1B2|nr:metalloprotease TldD [thiotrophic endosymbiont of Bathymodiolus puteoserpentis (Logatchev)]CAC9644816.1 TldD protein, part of TldE/TldD proteolytic complex [uncultured Gammaproteobacteria bacterium]CAC9970793.1 TldD protein, part of TldE/TldD proteolytic complex [uncultured Gammaproteobacteria bacterium]CAC9995654.1 TldD protein, part of TldE/TldD proteolytic complex [uncultured Gammaproteobacteria bacterium]SSC11291.1 TldD protein, part of TldE/TldD proteolytic complex [thiotrophic endosymb
MIEQLLNENYLNQDKIEGLLSDLFVKGIDYADLYFQHSIAESWFLEEGIVKSGTYNISHGVGARSVKAEQTGFAYSDDLNIDAIQKAVDFAKGISKNQVAQKIQTLQSIPYVAKYNGLSPLDSLNSAEKVDLLKRIDNIARKEPKVKQVSASLSGAYTEVLIVSTDGVYQKDYRPMVRISVSVIVEHEGRIESASSGGGGRYDYRYFVDHNFAEVYAQEAIRQALVALEAQDAPAGKLPVILGPGWPGVLLHEAIGHGLEGDFNRKGTSVFTGKIGEQVASEKCNIVDNGTLANRRGSLTVDDEGTQTQNTTLIENGILKGYMFDKMNAKLMGVEPTGNGRRESYAHIPMPRMTNTYMLNGEDTLEDMIASVDDGLYAVNFDGGQVDITSGKFVFSANEAYLIKNGKITTPVKGATLIGSGDEALKKISMVANDLKLDSGVGVCGKDGQSVPVGVGQPSLKIDELTVGGTQV